MVIVKKSGPGTQADWCTRCKEYGSMGGIVPTLSGITAAWNSEVSSLERMGAALT